MQTRYGIVEPSVMVDCRRRELPRLRREVMQMAIENVMYFALGLLVAGLAALVIMPAVWKRAVRLTKRRIEAATPITMAEFRADKDQLRAKFALSTRRLEMNVEALRTRLAEQLSDVDRKRSDLGALKTERDQHLAVVKELESREAGLRSRVAELERETTDLAQRLRMRDREFDARTAELTQLRAAQGDQSTDADNLTAAEARIASAEDRLKALLADEQPDSGAPRSLADKLGLEADVDALRSEVGSLEATILADWDSERSDDTRLRDRLGAIAATVVRLGEAESAEAAPAQQESLFDRMQRFAENDKAFTLLPAAPKATRRSSTTDRMAALKEIQGR